MSKRATRLVVRALLVPLAVALTLLSVHQLPASADAKAGTCGKGYKLERFTYSYPGYNASGNLMWKITWKKRWCYSTSKKRIGSFHAPKPGVEIYGIYAMAWNYKGITSKDKTYTNVDARGKKHPNYPRWGHRSWHKVKMDHCALKWAACTSHYYKVGTVGYWDGSKKVILP